MTTRDRFRLLCAICVKQTRILALLCATGAAALYSGSAAAQDKPDAVVQAAQAFLTAVDGKDEQRALSLMIPDGVVSLETARRKSIRMRLARGKLSNTRMINFIKSSRPSGYPYRVIFESDAEHDVIHGNAIRKTTVADIQIFLHQGVPMVFNMQVDY